MAFKHIFNVGTASAEVSRSEILAIWAVAQLPNTGQRHPRVSAIKLLRELKGGLGLYEAKQIVEYICDYGQLDGHGDVYIEEPKRVVTYTFGGA